jgi:hypothetical protein
MDDDKNVRQSNPGAGVMEGEQPMDAAVALHRRHMDRLDFEKEQRGFLVKALSRAVAVDGQSLHAASVGPTELSARRAWVAGTVEALSNAPTMEAFKASLGERMGELSNAFQDEPGKPSRVAFKGLSKNVFERAPKLAEQAGPWARNLWQELSKEDPVMSMGQALAAKMREAKLAAKGAFMSPEEGLAKQKEELMKRFGFNAISIEGDGQGVASQSFLLDKMEGYLARGAKDLGLASEKSVGMNGAWGLRVINEAVNTKVLGQLGYVWPSGEPVLAMSAETTDTNVFKHEWSHMLDARLGHLVSSQVANNPDASPWMKNVAKSNTFFSQMPKSVQELMPGAYEGYWQVAAAGQGMESGESLRQIEQSRQEKLGALSDRVQSRMLANPALMAGLGEAERAQLNGDVSGAVKFLLLSPKLHKSVVINGSSPYDFAQELTDPVVREAFEEISKGLEKQFGPAWRTGADGVELPAHEHLATSINHSVAAMESSAIKELASMANQRGQPINPRSAFAQASQQMDMMSGTEYFNSAHEMFARVIGRPEPLMYKVPAFSELVTKAGALWKGRSLERANEITAHVQLTRSAYSPSLDGPAREMVREGFSKMVEASGLGEAKLRRTAMSLIESAMLSPAGTGAIKGVVGALESVHLSGEMLHGAWLRMSTVSARTLDNALGHLGSGMGGLAAFGAVSSAEQALAEAKQGHVGVAVASGAEAAGSAVVAAGSVAGAMGIAKAAPLARWAGPVGAVLGYAGAAQTAGRALAEQKAGLKEESAKHWQAAGIRAGGATGSLAAGLAAGAALGSVAPGLGTIVGAAVGVAVAYASEKWAESVESPVVDSVKKMAEPVIEPPPISSIAAKLSAKRAAREASMHAAMPQEGAKPRVAGL